MSNTMLALRFVSMMGLILSVLMIFGMLVCEAANRFSKRDMHTVHRIFLARIYLRRAVIGAVVFGVAVAIIWTR